MASASHAPAEEPASRAGHSTPHADPIGPGVVSRNPMTAAALLAAVILVGAVGYVVIEGWSVWDAFYMTVTTVTTVGYREVHEMSFAGQAWTVVVLFGGVGTAFYTVTMLATVIVEGGLGQHVHSRRRVRMIDDLRDHFIVCGGGRIGTLIVDELRRQHIPHIVVERSPARVEALTKEGVLAVEADASNEDVLRRIHLDRARGLIAAVGSDAENVYTVMTARGLRPDLYIVGRAGSDDAGRKLIRAGANRVVSPYRIGARELAQTALRPAVVDFFDFATQTGRGELAIEQITITSGSTLDGVTIIQANIRQKFGAIVVGIQRHGGGMEFNPPGDAQLLRGDQLVVLGPVDGLRGLELAAAAAGTTHGQGA